MKESSLLLKIRNNIKESKKILFKKNDHRYKILKENLKYHQLTPQAIGVFLNKITSNKERLDLLLSFSNQNLNEWRNIFKENNYKKRRRKINILIYNFLKISFY